MPATLRIGTSAFTAAGWPGSFYPDNLKPADYLAYYAQHFDTVEVDSTFYRTPSLSTVKGWAQKTPKDFLFAAKVPRAITHDKVLDGCEREFKTFIDTMDALGPKLGPMLFQFPYFNRKKFKSVGEFITLLRPFLKLLPDGYRFVVEVRNRNWLDARLADALRERGVALALVDHAWMPHPAELFEKLDPITADFAYIRWLGDRKGIEERTKTWDRVIVDRSAELREWADICRKISRRVTMILAFANNHYAGHGPATVRQFLKLWNPVPKSGRAGPS